MRVIITGGGTGGHIYPGIAIAEALRRRKPETAILFVGGDRFEARAVPDEGWAFTSVTAARMPSRRGPRTLWSVAVMGAGAAHALWLVARWRPDAVVATGGYVCLPVGTAAAVLGKPLILQEQNAVPGQATRLLARWARSISVPNAEAAGRLPGRRTEVTGVPVRRRALEGDRARGQARWGLAPDRLTLLVIGGSQGALNLNRGISRMADLLMYEQRLQILHHTGGEHLQWVKQTIGHREHVGPPAIRQIAVPFLDPVGDAYACADLVVCRAGASTLAEVTAWGLPAVLVPYPHAADDHQEENAAVLERAGAAVRVADDALEGTALVDTVLGVIGDPARREKMSRASRGQGRPDAADAVAGIVLSTATQRSTQEASA
jgi:UDP-N-acetylglucosamine--N-acetylmuramyl-(pentapeptide) pyrophosphoryl-undecaprenol N-acetylglucosamine transferase